MAPSPAAQSGTLHRYSKRLIAFEHTTPSNEPSRNIILWIGGLGDGLHSVSYPSIIAQQLPRHWSLAQVQLLSSLNGWGTGSLQRDVRELSQCVSYFRHLKGPESKIILMGHSTGCQDVMEFVTGPGHLHRPRIDGAILQAPVSDREGMLDAMDTQQYRDIISTAEQYVKEGRENDALPQAISGRFLGRLPISAYRWLSLLRNGGDDDYFSSDLSDEQIGRTFGAFPSCTPLLILCSGADEHVPKHVDVSKLLGKWSRAVQSSGGILSKESGIVSGATHNLDASSEEVVQDLVRRVAAFAREVDGTTPSKLA